MMKELVSEIRSIIESDRTNDEFFIDLGLSQKSLPANVK